MIEQNENKDQIIEVDDNNGVMQGDDQKRTKQRRLTAKERDYISAIASGKTRRDAVREAYDVKAGVANSTVDNMAQRIEKRPLVMAILAEQDEQMQQTALEVIGYSVEMGRSGNKEGAQYARVALDGANSILDRLYGKAKQSIDVQSTVVEINIDLTSE